MLYCSISCTCCMFNCHYAKLDKVISYYIYVDFNSMFRPIFLCLISVVYLACTMALGTVSVCLTVLTLNLHHRDPERSVPRWAKVIILNYMSKILCVRSRKPRNRSERSLFNGHSSSHDSSMNLRSGLRRIAGDVHILRPMLGNTSNLLDERQYNGGERIFPSANRGSDEPQQREPVNNDWKEIAHVLDRLFFWIVFIFMTASTMIILSVPLYKDVEKMYIAPQR